MRWVVFLAVTGACISCDPKVDLNEIRNDQLISVTCFVSPADSIYKAYLFSGMAIGSSLDSDLAFVDNALVTISDGINYDTLYPKLSTDSSTGAIGKLYMGMRRHLEIKQNASYFLEVRTMKGQHLTATTRVPPIPGEATISGERLNNDYYFSASWINLDLHRYFSISLTATGSYIVVSSNGQQTFELNPMLVDITNFPSDRQLQTNSYEGRVLNAYLAEHPTLTVSIRNVGEDMFRFLDSYRRFKEWDANNSGNLLPNLREIPLIYSNINGGVGVFGSYNESKVEVEIQ